MFGQPHSERHCRKKALTTGVRRELVDYARQEHDSSLRRDCRLIGISDSSYRYRPMMNKDHAVIAGIQAAVERYPAYGFGKLLHILRRQGHAWNHKRVHRVYCQLNLICAVAVRGAFPAGIHKHFLFPVSSIKVGQWIS